MTSSMTSSTTSSTPVSPAALPADGPAAVPVLDAPAAVHAAAAPGGRAVAAEGFADRHIGPDPDGVRAMLAAVGHATLAELVAAVVPPSIRTTEALDVPPAVSEREVLDELRTLARRNTVAVPMIGLGYHGTVTPGVIKRNVLESPAWYTAYTP
jgi:glycine dehydrogenase